MTFRKFKILLRIWRKRGLGSLAVRLLERIKISLKFTLAGIYLRLNQNKAIEEIKGFYSDDPTTIFNFAATKFLGALSPGQIQEEFIPLLEELKRISPKTILEIGTDKGGSLFCFAKLAPKNATIISIELPPSIWAGGYPRWREKVYYSFTKSGQKMHLIRGNSHLQQTFEKLKTILGENKIDFLFIDADHSYYGVKKDFEMYAPLVRSGGIVAFHDIVEYPKEYDNQVSVFWNEIKNQYRFKELVKDWNQRCCGIGILYL